MRLSGIGLPFRVFCALVSLVLVACAPHRPGGASVVRDASELTAEQLNSQHFANVFEAVQSLRSNWLLTRGRDSFAAPSEVVVYMDDVRQGGVETLRSIAIATVVSIRRIDAPTATGRWGLGHGAGVISVSTQARPPKP